MNVSRASAAARSVRPGRLCAAVLLAGGLLLAAVPAVPAQDGSAEPSGPIPLFPPTVSPGAADDTAPAAPVPDEVPRAPRYEDIEINRLGELDPESLGILGPEHGGLGADAWANSDRPAIEAWLRDLPGDLASPSLRRLAVRLLLSSAKPPARTAAQGASPTMADAVAAAQETDFLRLRAERLYALGELAGLNRLLGLVPQRIEDPWLARARVDGLLLAGRDRDACGQVAAGIARYPQELYWAKAQVFCQLIAGQTDQALLGLDLLREQAPDSDPAFFRLANGFAGAGAGEAAAVELTPLNLAMLRKSGGTVPEEAAAGASPPLLHGIAGLAGGDPAVQATAVERLVEIGALPGERLAGAYGAFEFTGAELGDALAEAERGDGVRGRALLYQAANRENLAVTRAEILRAAFLAAEDAERAGAMAGAAMPLIDELAPSAELAWFAPLAARALYRAGQFERAGAWLSVLRLESQRQPDAQAAYAALRPLVRLAGGPEPLAGGSAPDRGLLLFVLSRALGQEEDLAGVETGDDRAAQALDRLPQLLALGDAAAAGRRGETVLLSVVSLGPAAPADSHPLALGYAVSALSAVGLGGDARALAIEAALAAGL